METAKNLTDLTADPVFGLQPQEAGSGSAGICRIRVLTSESMDIFENLAWEDRMTERAARDELTLLFWRNRDCVVIGRNQDPEAECRMDLMEELGIPCARRRTGGGAVFQDLGNLNVSFIAPADLADEGLFEEILLRALEDCGVRVRKTGRNDLVLDQTGEKISGSAARETLDGILLFHATLLLDVDLDRMDQVLTVSPVKLARHGIRSVRSRVTNLCRHVPDLTVEKVRQAVIDRALTCMGASSP